MVKIVNFSTLGAFTQYREVFYRVYVPPTEKSSKQRKPLIVVTNFGPLAVVVANICSTSSINEGISNDFLFNICLFVPITLSTLIDILDDNEFIKLIESRTDELLRRLIEGNVGLFEKINESFNNIMSWLKQQCFNREETIFVPLIEDFSEISNGEYAQYGTWCFNVWQLHVKIREIRISKGDIDISNEIVSRGILTAGLVPLTGSFKLNTKCGRLSQAIFRDPGEGFIEDFYEASLCIYLSHLRSCLDITYKMMNVQKKDLTIIVDTTHGINNATTMMMEVFKESMPLIEYDTKRNNINKCTYLFYNSDPVIPRDNSLQITFENNISYYYTRISSLPIRTLTNKLINRLLKDIIREKEKYDKELAKILYNLYLINLGLVIWGVYGLNRIGKINDRYKYLNIIEINCQCYRNSINIAYKLRQFRPNMFMILLTYWLYELLKESIEGFSKEVTIKGLNCWGKLIPNDNVECYDFEKIRELLIKYSNDKPWRLKLIRDIINDSALLIFDNEIREWLGRPYKRLYYQTLRNIFKPRRIDKSKETCRQILKVRGKSISGKKYYCVTPMREQGLLRNVVAHAGLTAVHRLVAFVFKDDNNKKNDSEKKRRCVFVGMCIAAPFPESMIKKLFKKYMLG
ncbi:MAG: CRISPR-associated DxTHG motif protein [Crenarchaeota archaeon]|nr:CRISPR-associated DxTHG motif protein [Thermoproteota archaeon]